MAERKEPCLRCVHKCELPGDIHIQCNDPPDMQAFVESAERAREVLPQFKGNVVFRSDKSGIFPFRYDGLTVLACSNFKEIKHD